MHTLIACCGLDCSQCDARIATLTGDEVLRNETARRWSAMNQAPEITPETICCTGCRTEGAKFCLLCPVRHPAVCRPEGPRHLRSMSGDGDVPNRRGGFPPCAGGQGTSPTLAGRGAVTGPEPRSDPSAGRSNRDLPYTPVSPA